MATNYRLKEGDKVRILVNARVDGYWFDSDRMCSGSWDSHFMLKGSEGVVICARTPKVWRKKGESLYFANIDVPHVGGVSRVRLEHSQIRKIKEKK